MNYWYKTCFDKLYQHLKFLDRCTYSLENSCKHTKHQLENKKKGQERGTIYRMMSEYFLEKTNWQLNTSSQEGSELINSAWSRACPLFILMGSKAQLVRISAADSH